jgi:hypothetical protein
MREAAQLFSLRGECHRLKDMRSAESRQHGGGRRSLRERLASKRNCGSHAAAKMPSMRLQLDWDQIATTLRAYSILRTIFLRAQRLAIYTYIFFCELRIAKRAKYIYIFSSQIYAISRQRWQPFSAGPASALLWATQAHPRKGDFAAKSVGFRASSALGAPKKLRRPAETL